VPEAFSFFIKNPVKGIDHLISALQLLQFYGYDKLALTVSQQVYQPIRDAKNLIPGGENYFADAFSSCLWQDIYLRLKRGEEIDSAQENKKLNIFNRLIREEALQELKKVVHCTQKGAFKDEFLHTFLAERHEKLLLLGWLFQRCMLEEKKMSFLCSYEIWRWMVRFWEERIQKKNGVDSIDEYFSHSRNELDDYLSTLDGFLSNQYVRVPSLLWGLPYIYDFLLMEGIISAPCSIGKQKSKRL